MSIRTIGVLAAGACIASAAQAQVNVQGFISGDNQFDAFTGTASGTVTHLAGANDWNQVQSFSTVFSSSGYIYVAVSDYGAVFGLGGYISTNGGASFDAILPGMGWESYNAGPNDFVHPDQNAINAFIAAANAGGSGGGSGWVPATDGTATISFGLPPDYNGMPALGCIWDPRADVNETVIFRLLIVPAPHSAAPLVAGMIALGRRRRSR